MTRQEKIDAIVRGILTPSTQIDLPPPPPGLHRRTPQAIARMDAGIIQNDERLCNWLLSSVARRRNQSQSSKAWENLR